MTNQTLGNAAEFDVTVTRVFDAPVERVWRAWSEAEEIKKWWGPNGFSCPVAEVDFREGGRALVAMRAPTELGMPDIFSTWNYTEIVPRERLAYIFNFSDDKGNKQPPIAPGIPADGRHEVVFTDLGGGKTQMTMTERGYTSQEARDTSKAGLEECLDKMTASFAA